MSGPNFDKLDNRCVIDLKTEVNAEKLGDSPFRRAPSRNPLQSEEKGETTCEAQRSWRVCDRVPTTPRSRSGRCTECKRLKPNRMFCRRFHCPYRPRATRREKHARQSKRRSAESVQDWTGQQDHQFRELEANRVRSGWSNSTIQSTRKRSESRCGKRVSSAGLLARSAPVQLEAAVVLALNFDKVTLTYIILHWNSRLASGVVRSIASAKRPPGQQPSPSVQRTG
jgi:hypothetical protein